jgi:pSer/pThr/pTyr-binding forkhead associated (FHA) protein
MERSSFDNPLLIGQAGPLNGQRWVITKPIVVGRDPACDIEITDRQVSRFHARFSSTRDGILLEDLGSKNGTFNNGIHITEPTLLKDGDQIHVGMIQLFVFLSSDSTMPLDSGGSVILERKGLLYVDNRSRRVWVGEKEVLPPLSVPQFRLIQILYEHQGDVVTRQDLMESIWGEQEAVGVSEQAFDALVRRLRDRLVSIDPEHQFIQTIRGHGLRLDNPSG